ncbi:DUF393 domain-containing protein [candidate division KSB1 bacterium]|nr:DUF393 domain-containing protein [candidate division KSB1 bacterium]RQW01222.1 MAG: DUF393 domain-containing protein [candidate division KSB1 bacterium]
MPASVSGHDKIILFDGVCNLCSAFLNFVYKFDDQAQFKFTWIQEERGTEILQWLGIPTENYKTIVYIENGRAFFKSTAFLKIVKYLKFPWPMLQAGSILPRRIRDWLYDIVAANRYRIFGKKDACLLPTGELKSRFL